MEAKICEKCGKATTRRHSWGFLIMRGGKKEYHYGCSEEHATTVAKELLSFEYRQQIKTVTRTS